MFRVSQHPSSAVLKTVTAASDAGHIIGRDWVLTWPRWKEVAGPILSPVPENFRKIYFTKFPGSARASVWDVEVGDEIEKG
jgi:hypothetical protein